MSANERLKSALRLILDDPDSRAQSGDSKKRVHRERWHGTAAAYPPSWEEDGCVDYFYRRDTILARTADVDAVFAALVAEAAIPRADIETRAVIDGVTRLAWRYGRTHRAAGKAVSKHPPSDTDDDPQSTPKVLEKLDRVLGVGVATPLHALSLCGDGHPCPATEPVTVPSRSMEPVPPVNSGICCGTHGWDGRGVQVGVVDGGLVKEIPDIWPWMAGVCGDEDPYQSPGGPIQPYAGHGTFVAGCVRCTAPKADVCVKKAEHIDWRPDAGMAYEDEILRKMEELLDLGTDVIVCEFDGVTRLHLPLKTFEAFYDNRLRQLKNVVIVAPAGNDETRLPTFPAAYSWVIGVGALSADTHRRASFSNYGGWVDVFAPGEELVNAFPVGTYTCIEDPSVQRQFDGLAGWSGTSFSAPLVAGMIAARMSATGESAPRAAEALLRFARSQAIPRVGPVLMTDQVCGTPREPRHGGCDCGCG